MNLPIGTILTIVRGTGIPTGFIEYRAGKRFDKNVYGRLFHLFQSNYFPEDSSELPVGTVSLNIGHVSSKTWVRWDMVKPNNYPELTELLEKTISLIGDAESKSKWESALAANMLPEISDLYFRAGTIFTLGNISSGSAPNTGFQMLPVMVQNHMKVHPLGVICPDDKETYSAVSAASVQVATLPAELVLLAEEAKNINPSAKMVNVNLSGSGNKLEPAALNLLPYVKVSSEDRTFMKIIKAF